MAAITNILNKYGESLTYKAVSETYNDRGDATETTSDSIVTAAVQVMSGDEEIVKAGILEVGDAIAFFEPTTTVNLGDRILYQNTWYDIVGVITERQGSTNEFIEARLKKRIKGT